MEIPYTITARPDTGLSNGKLGVWLFLASEVMLFGSLFTAYLFVRIGADPGTWPDHVQNVWLGLCNTIVLIISSITMVYAWVALKERKFNNYRLALVATIACGGLFLCIKGFEYRAKYVHFGFMVKETAFSKYEDQLKKIDGYYSPIPTQDPPVVEVRGHWEGMTPDGQVIIAPDENPHPINYQKPETASGGGSSEGAGAEEPTITLDLKDVDRYSRLLPKYGTYYAMYFTVTGLHALHIIGGLVVMLYFLGPGAKMYRRNPEQLANRVEVTGIFWHFVDLVWITVFPILYLT